MTSLPVLPRREALRPSSRVLVVGAGLAGAQVAVGLRDAGWGGSITVVGDEAHPPYHRPPLSKGHLSAAGDPRDLVLREQDFWAARDVDLVLGDAVQDLGLGPDGSGIARTTSGREIGYDRLVMATGARPRTLPVLRGCEAAFAVRSVDDAERLRPHLRPGARVVVVGAGFIGLEVAATARAAGAEVTVIEAGEQVLGRVVGAETAHRVAAHHAAQGIDIRCGVVLREVRAEDGRLNAVVLNDGTEIACDVVVVGIGAEPCTGLAEQAGLEVRGGIVVDAGQRASDAHTLAVGDCSVGWAGVAVRLESVDHATQSAAAAVAALLGHEPPTPTRPWFWSDQGSLKLQVVGLRSEGDRVLVREDPARGRYAALHLRDGVLVAAEVIGAPADFMVLRRAVGAGLRPAPDQVAALSDPTTKLATVL